MRAGALDRRALFLRRVLTHDGYQQVETWQPLGARWVSRRPVPGYETAEGLSRRGVSRYSLRLRVDSLSRTLTAADAVAMDGERYEMTAPPRPVDASRGHEIEVQIEGTGEAWP